jgi:hypothetical protein
VSKRRRQQQDQHNRKLRGESRTIPIVGFKKDAGKFYHCWYCGFVNDVRDNTLGNAESTDATVLTRSQLPSDERPVGGRGMDIKFITVSPEVDADGNPKSVKEAFTVEGGGCPLCHTCNWRGDF